MANRVITSAQAQALSIPLAGIAGGTIGYLAYDDPVMGIVAGVGLAAGRGYLALADYGAKPKRASFNKSHSFDMSIGAFNLGFNVPMLIKRSKPEVAALLPDNDFWFSKHVLEWGFPASVFRRFLAIAWANNSKGNGLSERRWVKLEGGLPFDSWSVSYYGSIIHHLRYTQNHLRHIPIIEQSGNNWLRLANSPCKVFAYSLYAEREID